MYLTIYRELNVLSIYFIKYNNDTYIDIDNNMYNCMFIFECHERRKFNFKLNPQSFVVKLCAVAISG